MTRIPVGWSVRSRFAMAVMVLPLLTSCGGPVASDAASDPAKSPSVAPSSKGALDQKVPHTAAEGLATAAPVEKPTCMLDADSKVPGGALRVTDVDLQTAERRAVFVALVDVRNRAIREASPMFEEPNPGLSVMGTSSRKAAQVRLARQSMVESLERRYLAEIMAREHLSCDAVRFIFRQGTQEGWASS